MTTFVRQPPQKTDIPPIIPQLIVAGVAGFILFIFTLIGISGLYQFNYAGKIFPGVTVAGVDVSGLAPIDAAAKMVQTLTYPYSGRLVFRDGERIWVATPTQLGMLFDPGASANIAYALGRNGGLFRSLNDQLNARQMGVDVPPVVVFDQRAAYQYLQTLSTEINQPVQEAHLEVSGTQVIAAPGQTGRALNIEATLLKVSAQLQSFRDGEVLLAVDEVQPEVMDVTPQVEQARRLLSNSLTLTLPDAVEGDPGPWVIEPAALAQLLIIQRVRTEVGVQFQLALDTQKIEKYVDNISGDVNRDPTNARFTFNDETRQLDLIQPAVIGRAVKIGESVDAINTGALSGETSIALKLDIKTPAVTSDATAASLGITENIYTYTSFFRGSGAARMQNIQTAAAQFHGLLIAPGQTFSMGQIMGDVSLDNGYAEALIIYGGRTIKGVGGGVCQVSSTLFRTAFFAGFPIVERHPHAYRVLYYEQVKGGIDPNLAGLDATVYFPLVDFKFTNDTPYWLLMETYFSPKTQTLTWKFYSTSDGRTVEWNTTGLQNVVEAPEPVYTENPDLPLGEVKQVDYAAAGADVTVTRTVFRDGAVYLSDIFKTSYEPWQEKWEYGPGTEGMPPSPEPTPSPTGN